MAKSTSKASGSIAMPSINMEAFKAALDRVAQIEHHNPDVREQALKIARGLLTPTGQFSAKDTGRYYNIKHGINPEDVRTTIGDIPGVKLKKPKSMSWQDFYQQAKGGTLINIGGDRSNLGRLTHINDQKLAWPVDLHAGAKYMLEPNPNAVWANNPTHGKILQNQILKAAEKGPVYGAYTPMGPGSVDSSHNMFDALMAQIPMAKISKKDAKEFDTQLKMGSHVQGKNEEKRKRAAEIMKDWPGIQNAKAASEFARGLTGDHRKDIVQYMDQTKYAKAGFPEVGVTRAAITDPALLGAPGNMIGHRIVKFDPNNLTPESKKFEHSTYTTNTGGELVGDVPLVQRHHAMPDVIDKLLAKPTASGDVVHPYSVDPMGRSTSRKMFEEQKQMQPINERMINSIGEGQRLQEKYGFADGGEVDHIHEMEAQHFSNGGDVMPKPKKTVKAYKLFRTKRGRPGELFPLFVDANTPVPIGKWVAAKAGEPGKDPSKVKSKLGDLAYRPGWHSGDLPIATHIGGKSDKSLDAPDYRPNNQVWAEVEHPADVDWQSIANSRMQYTKAGKPKVNTAHITDQVPMGGFYRYKTNPNMTGNWLISGGLKVNRVLSDDEVKAINDEHGVADLPRLGKSHGGEVEPIHIMHQHFGDPIFTGAMHKAEGGEVGQPISNYGKENDLLNPIGQSKMIGRETSLFDEGMYKAGISDFPMNNRKSIRYLHHDENNNPIGALQIMTDGPRSKKATIQNVYVAEPFRRNKIASGLLQRARQDFDVKHSKDLTNAGKAFAKAVKSGGGEVDQGQDGITAYHGSPHDFEQFDTSKIGTGEGVQSFGHGLYFAEAEPTAQAYKKQLAGKDAYLIDHIMQHAPELRHLSQDEMNDIKRRATDESLEPERAALWVQNGNRSLRTHDTNRLANVISSYRNAARGHMYEVRIKGHPDQFLHWDKPLSEQSEHIQNAIKQIYGKMPEKMTGNDLHDRMNYDLGGADWPVGANFEERKKFVADANKRVAQKLYEHGIKGIKYFDHRSRASTGNQTHNYVVFDDKDVNIKRKYAQGGDVGHRVHFPSLSKVFD